MINQELMRQKYHQLVKKPRKTIKMERLDDDNDFMARVVEVAMLEQELKYVQEELRKKRKLL